MGCSECGGLCAACGGDDTDARDAARWRALRPALAAWVEAEAAYEAARRALSGNNAASCAAFERARYTRVETATAAYEAIEAALRGEP